MIKALFVATIAGTHRAFLLPYVKRFREMGWRIDAAAVGIRSLQESCNAYHEVFEMEWSRNPLELRRMLASAHRIRKIVEAGSYDIVHVHTPIAAFVTRFALRRMRLQGRPKVVYTAHGFHFHPLGKSLPNAIYQALEKIAGRWTDRLIVINECDLNAAVGHRIVPGDKIVHMPGIGIDRNMFSPTSVGPEKIARAREELGIDDGTPLFLMVADFMPGKRHVDAIEAFRALKRDGRLAFAGTGKLFGRIKQLVKASGLEGRILFLGLRDDIPILMRSSVATIIPSVREGLSRSVMESLCLEVPVIGTDIRGVRDLLEKGGGLLIPVRSPGALRVAMEWVLDHPQEAKVIGKRGRETTIECDIAHLIQLHDNLYGELISQ